MRIRTILLAAGVVGGLSQTGDAYVPRRGQEASYVVAGQRAPRTHVRAAYVTTTLAQHGLDRWHAIWDVDTDVPSRLWGSTAATAGAVANAATAEAAARQFLATHLALLAPGAAIGDFSLVANVVNPMGDMRTVSFQQSFGGVRVLESSVAFAFKNDRIMLVSSSAKPSMAIHAATATFKPDSIKLAATAWLATGGKLTRATTIGERVIVPMVRPRTRAGLEIAYRLADTVEVESLSTHDRWTVWVGADDGVAFARASKLMYTTGTVLYDVWDQSPTVGTHHAAPAANTTHTVDGTATLSDVAGVVTWNTNNNATVNPGLTGTLVRVVNQGGANTTANLSLAPAGTVTWSMSTQAVPDAEINSFIFANVAKQFAKTHYNPTLPWIVSQQLEVDTNNTTQECNAFWDGTKLNFIPSTPGQCENTGRMADVVYHEFGHGLHQNSIIAGVGNFDPGLSEGLADTNAVAITGDSGLGRGFDFTTAPLRQLNPATKKRWPVGSEPHNQGEVIGETLWDLRTALQTKLGQDAGFTQFLKIYYSIMQRASDISTTTYPEALAADDDDGDLSNGTPNECEINAAFAAHNISDPTLASGLVPPTRDNLTVTLSVAPAAASACPGPPITKATLNWRVRGGNTQSIDMTMANQAYSGDLPTQPDDTVVEYQVVATYSDGTSSAFPENPADPFYEMYIGAVTPLWCADFETGATDWTHKTTPAANDEWEAGMPMGLGGDPRVAHGGTGVFGIDLTHDGVYDANTTTTATSPEIDLMGHSHARLQLYRWLNVEDGFYEHATISVNSTRLWTNAASPAMPSVELNHTDKEWRFQDLDLSSITADKITLGFGLMSDEELELGGWTLDDVCIVVPAGSATCGNGTVEDGETCDDGNTTDGDGCSSTCQTEDGHGGGCCSTGGGPGGPIALGAVVIGLALRRRRAGRAA